MATSTDPQDPADLERLIDELELARSRIVDLEELENDHFRVMEDLHLHQEELNAQNRDLREAQHALVEAGRRYQDLFDFAPVAYFLLDQRGAIEEVNFIACQILEEDRVSLLQRQMRLFIPAEGRAAFDMLLINAAASRKTGRMDTVLCKRSQGCLPVQLTLTADRVNDRLSYRLAVMDASEHQQVEEQRRLAATMFEESNEGVMITDSLARIQRVNRSFTVVTGYIEQDILGQKPSVLASGRHDPSFYRRMWERLLSVGSWSGEIWNRRKNGEIYPEWLKISTVRGADGEIRHFVGIFSDIGNHRQSGQDVERFAFYDTLTDLPNRTLFVERLKHGLLRAHRENRPVVLLFLDLDGFKAINDSLGHQLGDLLLQQVAERLHPLVRAHDTVARLGGDEFTVMLADIDDEVTAVDIARRVAESIRDQLSLPFRIEDREVSIGTSIGIALYPRDGDATSDLIKHADIAMYHAKHAGGSGFAFFSSEMNERVRRRVSLESALRSALQRGELTLAYQPVIDAEENRVIGVEALLRWMGPDGPVAPLEFIPVLEMLGLAGELSAWVLANATREVAGWKFAGAESIWLSVNLSPRQLHLLRADSFAAILWDSGLPAQRLVLEISEDHLFTGADAKIDLLEKLRGQGVRVALDDFGSGHSSLGELRNFPLDMIKIDQHFVQGLPDQSKDVATVNIILNLAGQLGLQALAEGVESAAQRDALRAQGCTVMQGYTFARPMSAEDCTRWCAAYVN